MADDRSRTYHFTYPNERKVMIAQRAAEERGYLAEIDNGLAEIQLDVTGENPEELDELVAELGGVVNG